MRSEMRRAAMALVEERREAFESLHPLEASKARLAQALAPLGVPRAVRFEGAWIVRDGHDVFEAAFGPTARARAFLNAAALGLLALVVASAWALHAPGENKALRFLLPMFTVLALLAFPFVATALGSTREAEESRIRRAIRTALQDEDARFPPQQRWSDED